MSFFFFLLVASLYVCQLLATTSMVNSNFHMLQKKNVLCTFSLEMQSRNIALRSSLKHFPGMWRWRAHAELWHVRLYLVLWWHLWMTFGRRLVTSAPAGRGKSAHRKCSDTEVQFACTVPQAAPAVNWGLSPLTKPHPGLHHQSEKKCKERKWRGSRTQRKGTQRVT